jgi:hypothetical protein
MGRTITLIASIILIVIVGVATSTLLHTGKPHQITVTDPVSSAIAALQPLNGCSQASSKMQPASDGFPEVRVLQMNCNTRTAATLDAQISAQIRTHGYDVQASNAPQWGCYEKNDGSTLCSDELNANKNGIRARYVITIADAAGEANPTLGTRDYLSPIAVTGYRLQLSR